MVDYKQLAIADVLKHPKLGLVSHQPTFTDEIRDEIRVRDIDREVHTTLASECEFPTEEEYELYWKEFNEGLI